MRVVGVVTLPLGDALVAIPVSEIPYANLDAPRMPGGLFVDERGQLGIAVDPRANDELRHAATVEAARQAHALLHSRSWVN